MVLPRRRRYHPWEVELERPAAVTAALEAGGPAGHPAHSWLEIDEATPMVNSIRAALFAERRDAVFMSEGQPAIHNAKAEVLAHVVGFLVRHHPDVYQLSDSSTELIDRCDPKQERRVRIAAPYELGDPLLAAASLINEDLVILVPSANFPAPAGRDASDDVENDYRVAAAVVCFPAHWCLREKFSKGLLGVHKFVPWFETLLPRVQHLFNSVVAGLPDAPAFVVRKNWFLFDSPQHEHDMFQPMDEEEKDGRELTPAESAQYWATRLAVDDLYVRIERQTISRLPVSGAVLFTVRSYQHALATMRQHRAQAGTLAAAIRGLTSAAWRYKKADRWAEAVLPFLDALAADVNTDVNTGTGRPGPATKSRL